MKKNIRLINMDSALQVWLLEKLLTDPPKDENADELLAGVQDMLKGEVASLLLSQSNETDYSTIPTDHLKIGELEIYPKSRRVIIQSSEVNLTPKEFDLLYFLAKNQGEVFTKEQIYRAVWADEYLIDGSNVMAFIRKLRKKIEPNPDAPQYILTIWGIGYKFNDML
ncbi:winged helix-turn-helix domain-containing protein [Clostridioides difficile]|nr:winged helix family transcriptional regulator [Clostridioides difficile]EKG0799232.1 winged helix-turn-helix transcriptional regulator [Clostridioides difficile]EKS6830851.1 winged helix-turn-helix transcriptional regulator [Clostridioides difficile]MBY2252334.1 winged helix-turn-helix domain-containing protein [Clostridioides difficile]MCI2384809.1 winged helix-turn-helix domain-containing protein [Clostridioides difficile]